MRPPCVYIHPNEAETEMAIRISFQNSDGEMDSRIVRSPVDAPEAVRDMVMEAGELHVGDQIIISDVDDEDAV